MAGRGRQMRHDIYQVPLAKIDLIPHGIPDLGFVDPTYFKDQFGVEAKVVLLSFELLSPNKGIEHVLNALRQILAEFPEVVYIVLGTTHPNEIREHGEAYRLSLKILVFPTRKNRIDKTVIFYDQFGEQLASSSKPTTGRASDRRTKDHFLGEKPPRQGQHPSYLGFSLSYRDGRFAGSTARSEVTKPCNAIRAASDCTDATPPACLSWTSLNLATLRRVDKEYFVRPLRR